MYRLSKWNNLSYAFCYVALSYSDAKPILEIDLNMQLITDEDEAPQ